MTDLNINHGNFEADMKEPFLRQSKTQFPSRRSTNRSTTMGDSESKGNIKVKKSI
jgi:hypothetical protein